MRVEKDFLGSKEIPSDALYGIHSVRALENFANKSVFNIEWYKAMGLVKHSCYQAILSYIAAVREKYGNEKLPTHLHRELIFALLAEVAFEVSTGAYSEHFIVPAIQGGAGTSVNMNMNEILANVALIKLGKTPGAYSEIDPVMHANAFQSTNDVVPTALKLAAMRSLARLELAINGMRSVVEGLERNGRDSLRMSYTQMQAAVPSSFGMLFGAYNEALSRDWWRVSKCFERIKVVNLGGGATGTGLSIPRFYIAEVLSHLQKLSGFPLTRGEHLTDTTQNMDVFVEVHAILKAHAVNLEKIASDIRILSSDLVRHKALSIPDRQAGSSIMPGKVNPVIAEYVIGVSHRVYSNDMLISHLCGQGSLDLNAYIPLIGHALLESIELLEGAVHKMHHFVFAGLSINRDVSMKEVLHSPGIATALVPHIGYEKATEVALLMKTKDLSIFDANAELMVLPVSKLQDILSPDRLLQLGFTLRDT